MTRSSTLYVASRRRRSAITPWCARAARRAIQIARRARRCTATPCSSASRTTLRQTIVGARSRRADRRDALRAQRLEHRVDAVDQHASNEPGVRAASSPSGQRARERRRPLAVAGDVRNTCGFAAALRRCRSPEPPGRAPGLRRDRSGPRESDGRALFPFDPFVPYTVRDRAKFFTVQPRRRRQLLGKSSDNGPRAGVAAFPPEAFRPGAPTGVVVEQERESARHLAQPVD